MKKNKGFTVIELVIAITIMSFVMGGVFIMFSGAVKNKIVGDGDFSSKAASKPFFREIVNTLNKAEYEDFNLTGVSGSTLGANDICIYNYYDDLNASNFTTVDLQKYTMELKWVVDSEGNKKQLELIKINADTGLEVAKTVFPKDEYIEKYSAFTSVAPIVLIEEFTKDEDMDLVADSKYYSKNGYKVKVNFPYQYNVDGVEKTRRYLAWITILDTSDEE